jgi:hypothetical protein
MQIVLLYDRTREPQGWMQIIRPTEFAAFATLADSGAACDADGVPTNMENASCVIFETLSEAETFCRERVLQIPSLRFDIRDAAGLRRPPLFTIVHPSRTAALDDSPAKMRRNTYAAVALFAVGPALIWFDWTFHDGLLIMPTILGINALLIAARLLIMNAGHIAAERARRERVAQVLGARPTSADLPADLGAERKASSRSRT